MRYVDHASGNERAPVSDPNYHGPPRSDVRHAQPAAKWQCRVSSGQFVRIELFAARGPYPIRVEAGKAILCILCVDYVFVRRPHRYMPIRHG